MGDLLEFHRHLFLKKLISGRNGAGSEAFINVCQT